MTEHPGTNDSPNPSNCSESSSEYLSRASQACEAGDLVLGMHLYLTAYEKAAADPDIPDGMALAGLQEAWSLACALKERSIAEYVFEKLEPFLMPDEIPEYASELQNLALARLEEYGLSREDLADMAQMISQDIADGNASVVKVESFEIPRFANPDDTDELIDLEIEDGEEGEEALIEDNDDTLEPADSDVPQFVPTTAAKKGDQPNRLGFGVAELSDFNPYDMHKTSSVGKSYHAATNEGSGSYVFTRDKERAEESKKANVEAERKQAEADAKRSSPDSSKPATKLTSAKNENSRAAQPAASTSISSSGSEERIPSMPDAPQIGKSVFNYNDLVGYGEVVSIMRDFGVGLQRDRGFQNFVSMMNARHGVKRMPSLDTVLFRSPVLEDASRFLEATIGEIGLPVLRMSMEENFQGMPMLCVSVQGNSRPRMNHAHNRFEGPGILVIEDLDMWALPTMPEGMEGIGGFMMANISRGAREAVNLIQSAVEDPNVYVLVTATTQGDVDPFFYNLFEPMTVIEIGYPNEQERGDIWSEIMRDHSSMTSLDRAELTRLSAGLARYDIYMAAREAIEEAYKTGLVQRTYVPVTAQNIYDKLAACHPLDSDEYQVIEDEVIQSFRNDLEHLEDLIDGSDGLRS